MESETLQGIITTIESVSCRVDTPLGEYVCAARRKLTESDTGMKKPLAVGDRVVIEETGNSGEKAAVITELLPRSTRLSRCHPANPRLEQVIAANVDQALIVSAVRSPPLTAGIIDRYIIAAEYGGIRPIVCINKTDLATEKDRYLRLADTYRRCGYDVLLTSAETGQGIEELKSAFKGYNTVLAGHSGVGKSSLINAVQPGLRLRTAPIGWKGRHCTAKANLLKLDSAGYVVDTPGIRELQPWDIEKGDVHQFFPEIWEKAGQCRMPDCSHLHEPDCAVISSVEAGLIPLPRYESYTAIMETLETGRLPRNTDVEDPDRQIPKNKRQRSRHTRKQNLDKLLDEHWT